MKTYPVYKPVHSAEGMTFRAETAIERKIEVPFMRPDLNDTEIEEVVDTLRSGWLTTGPKTKRFEENFAKAVNAEHAIALNSCTAALHLGAEALGLAAGQAVLVPTMTFAATAEILLYIGAIPILVDCDPETGNIDLIDARRKIAEVRSGKLDFVADPDVEIVGVIPVHVGGFMIDIDELKAFAKEFDLWILEDAAHAIPSAWRRDEFSPWQYCGDDTADITCYSFYANKTITTGEGGMAVTQNQDYAEKIKLMSLHGLSRDAWNRYSKGGTWDYQIIAPGYKYNITDIASSIGIHQLARAEEMRRDRERIAHIFLKAMSDVEEIELPIDDVKRLHSWHLFPIRIVLSKLEIDRNRFIEELNENGVGTSVHWRPLHLHPLYSAKFKWEPHHLPAASQMWERIISLPIFPSMRSNEVSHVIKTVKDICIKHSKTEVAAQV